ncbi:MAG: VCBS repeat-containing protein [Chitinophagaceae bacterium]|nr:MAG: VCBS repeat-containing protein [Chitinophagaceae bacterium]
MKKLNALFFLILLSADKEISFRKTVLSTQYISEGVAVADVNKDGKPDVIAGTFWWKAPNWEKMEITTPYIHPSEEGYGNSFLNFSLDVNNDGWDDLMKVGLPGEKAFWYENPKNKKGHWKERLLYHSVGNESPTLVDIDGDGRNDMLCNDSEKKKVIWLDAPHTKGDTAWSAHVISDDTLIGTHKYTHGLGYGDINGDGRKDVVIRDGWWEGPQNPREENWTFHKADLGDECAQMYVVDVDVDGDSDVISSSAHNYGIWWYEQVREGDSAAWKKHEIFKQFSQTHGLAFTDINGDGHPDLVTGKRFWAHNGNDPGEKEPAVLYWFEFIPGKTPKFIPHEIDNNSGAGLQVIIVDLNKDGKNDIVTANKKGVFVFEQNTP